MSSPFPGMDPYLEASWLDVRPSLITYACDQLQPLLPEDLVARINQRAYVEPEHSPAFGLYPAPCRIRCHAKGMAPDAIAVAIEDQDDPPIEISLGADAFAEAFIEIRDLRAAEDVITIIEVLSLSVRFAGEGQQLYRQKQKELNEGGISLVEIDLLRSGGHVLNVPSRRIPRSYRTPYRVCVRRGWRPRRVEFYRAPLEKRLPTIQIPLRETDQDVPLDLQSLIDLCYRNGRYDRTDYTVEPDPPFDSATAAWAIELLKAKGLR